MSYMDLDTHEMILEELTEPGMDYDLQLSPQDDAEKTLPPFENLYKLEECIGEGSFGSVYKAENIRYGKKRAVKIVNKKRETDDMLRNEFLISSCVDHPNTLGMLELFEDENNFYFTMDVMNHGSLADILKGNRVYSEEVCSLIIKDILDAVEYLHESGIVHRDIKPENVFVGGTNEDPSFKLGDFGLSEFFGEGVMEMVMTDQMGTPSYAAPEILTGKYNEKIDIWAVGVMAYVMTVGYVPFPNLEDLWNDDDMYFEIPREFYRLLGDDVLLIHLSPLFLSFLKSLLDLNPCSRPSARECLAHPWITKYNH